MNKICVYAICKNEEKFVEKWLNSMSEADYIVVLDTGSTDGTYEKLKNDKRVTRVEQEEIKPWRFDVARNKSMELIPEDADILVCTDFDEEFNKGWAEVLRKSWGFGCNMAHYMYSWSSSGNGEPQNIFTYNKIHNRDFKWIYPVHEILAGKYENMQEKYIDLGFSVFLRHYPDKTKERSYYFELLQLSVEENTKDPHVISLLAREYMYSEKYDLALKLYESALNVAKNNSEKYIKTIINCMMKISYIYRMKEEYELSIKTCMELIRMNPTFREPYMCIAQIYDSLDIPTLTISMVEAALKNGVIKYTNCEERECWSFLPYVLLGCANYRLGIFSEARENFEKAHKIEPQDELIKANYNACVEAEKTYKT